MHGDTKVGLAMAIVLIGLAAALCFPRQSAPVVPSLGIEDSRALDAEIEQLPVRAYIGSESRIVQAVTPEPLKNVVVPPRPAFSPHDIAQPEIRNTTRPTPVPNPIPPASTATPDAMTNRSVLLSTGPSSEMADGSHEETIHVVESGDTLSGLAGRYLGSVAKFDVIYEANRDQLANPNALKLGMKLRIPAKSGTSP